MFLEGDVKAVYTSIKKTREDYSYNGSVLRDIFLMHLGLTDLIMALSLDLVI